MYINFQPWYRFNEQEKAYPGDPKGDDNPDIRAYLGWFELSAAYKQDDATWRMMVRHNLQGDSRSAVKLCYSRPFNKYIRIYAELFSGYGESLIDSTTLSMKQNSIFVRR